MEAVEVVRDRMERAATNAEAGDVFLSDIRLSRQEFRQYTPLMNRQTGGSFNWTDFDFRNYLQHFWHPGRPRGFSCRKLDRLGGSGDGSKQLCEAERTLNSSRPCLVLSVGSRGDVKFEKSLHDLAPSCEIEIMDPTLDTHLRHRIPSWATFYPEWFTARTARLPRYRGRQVNLLKIDCEGCEYMALPEWIRSTCTDQIIIEVHGQSNMVDSPGMTTAARMRRFHTLMSLLEANFTIFAAEPNLISPPFTNVEFGLLRRMPCLHGARRL